MASIRNNPLAGNPRSITREAVEEVVHARLYNLANPQNITAFDQSAKVVASALTGKAQPFKQDLDAVKTILTIMYGEANMDAQNNQEVQPDEEFEGSLDDLQPDSDTPSQPWTPDSEADVSRETETPELHQDEDHREHEIEQERRDAEDDDQDPAGARSGDEEAEDSADPSEQEENGEEDGEDKPELSVVKGKYRAEYKARGNARNCGDWFARLSDGFLLPKKKLDIDAWKQISELNELGDQWDKWTSPEKQMRNGWQGRARMSISLPLRIHAARENGLNLPRELYNRMAAKLEADNKRFIEAEKHGRVVEWEIFEELDDVVVICPKKGTPDETFFNLIIAKHGENSKKLAEGRKTAKSGEAARASEEGAGE